MTIAVLCTQARSPYHHIAQADCYHARRDAYTYCGPHAIVAHPPCAQWSNLRKLARIDARQKALAPWCVHQVRHYGGVLEHPATSQLWKTMRCADAPAVDQYGGYILYIEQHQFGHPARKRTGLYIVGVPLDRLPPIPLSFLPLTRTVCSSSPRQARLPQLSAAGRSRTPAELALWLIEVARRVRRG